MVESEKTERFNIKVEVKAVPCPKCETGHLQPFVNEHCKDEDDLHPMEFSHFDLYYRCSDCYYRVEGKTYSF